MKRYNNPLSKRARRAGARLCLDKRECETASPEGFVGQYHLPVGSIHGRDLSRNARSRSIKMAVPLPYARNKIASWSTSCWLRPGRRFMPFNN